MVTDPRHCSKAERRDGGKNCAPLVRDSVSASPLVTVTLHVFSIASGNKPSQKSKKNNTICTPRQPKSTHSLISHRSRFAPNVNLLYKLCRSPKMFCCGLAVGLDPCLILQLWEQSLLSTQETGGQTSGSLYFFCQRKCLFSPVVWKRARRREKVGPRRSCRDLPRKTTLPNEKELDSTVSAQRLGQGDK